MKTNKYLLTEEGLEKAKQDLAAKLSRKEELKEVLNSTRQAGDLKENDGYTLAVEDFKNNEEEIAKLEDLISNAKIVKNKVKGKVEIGDKVVVQDNKGLKRELTLVGDNEANPLESKISYNSPMGKVILGKKEGDKFELQTPKEKVAYTILQVLD